ncbi:MAG TPA: 1-acyl-sn-glycerol-3-phosphate acyltransferase [Bacteroidales bacterium]|nr:1-acyl-sn-glycerol-3-phosphate acyltransferase [Bacteroidales bacterium]
MTKKKIQDKQVGYDLIKGFIQFIFPKFYRQIEVRGLENIPEDEPLIFAGNHQNGVMDPVAIIIHQKEPIVYMARADIFRNSFLKVLLRFIKITPIYRIRDGFENLSKNDQQIKEAIDVLLDRKCLGIMPEGNHGEQHRLRPFVKGLFRIGYQAEVLLQDKAHVKIIPVGIDYNFYQHSGSDLVITYGKAIEMKDYLPIYLENQAIGLNTLKNVLSSALSELMLDIRSKDYERTYRLCCMGVPAFLEFQAGMGRSFTAATMAGLRFDARVALAKLFDRLEVEEPSMLNELDALTAKLNQLPGYPSEITEWLEDTSSSTHPALLVSFALILSPGFLLNFPAWSINRLIVSKIEDKQMHATFVFTLGMLINFLVYLALTFIAGNLLNVSLPQYFILFILIGTLGIVSEKGRQVLRIPWRKLRYSFGKRKTWMDYCKTDFLKLQEKIGNVLERNEKG